MPPEQLPGEMSQACDSDVDEAMYLADRIVLSRDRRDVLEHPDYRRLRQSIIGFLENHSKQSLRTA